MGLQIKQRLRSGDAFRSCSLRHDAATAAFPAAQSFDELGNWSAGFYSEANKLTLRYKAAVLAR
jgi:hypothetical protein